MRFRDLGKFRDRRWAQDPAVTPIAAATQTFHLRRLADESKIRMLAAGRRLAEHNENDTPMREIRS